MKKTIIGIIIVVVFLVGGSWLSKTIAQRDPDIISRQGLHWHPRLMIYMNDVQQVIPANVGIAIPGSHPENMHTHAGDNVIHVEIPGVVRKDELMLGHFFKVWNKDIEKNDFGMLKRMAVNGQDSTELGNYMMSDGDKIELWYETK